MNTTDFKKWNKAVIAGLAVSCAFVVGFNVVVDPYEVFHTGYVRQGAPTNERFNKVEHLLSHKGEYNTLIMGSSVMGAFEPEWLSKGDPKRHVYNASFLGGLPSDALKVLKLLKERNERIDEIYMGIDLFPFMQAEDSKSPSKQHHYLITGESKPAFFANYMFASSVWHGWTKINESRKSVPNIRFDIESTGRYYLLKQDQEMAQDIDGYVKKHFGNKKVAEIQVSKVAWIDLRFDELSELVNWTKEQGIKTTFFIHPFHRLLRDNVPAKDMDDFRQRINAITGQIPDFTLDRAITDNDALYYDPKHYVPGVAKQIVEKTLKV